MAYQKGSNSITDTDDTTESSDTAPVNWGLILFIVLLFGGGLFLYKRRNKTQK